MAMFMRSLFSEEENNILDSLQSNVISSKARLLRTHKRYVENNKGAIDLLGKVPRILQIETIASCNAKCIMCPTPWIKRKRRKVIDDKLFEKIVDDCFDLKPKMIWFYLNGEPFLDPKIFNRLDYLKKRRPSQMLGLYTNASLLNKDKIQRLFEYNLKIIHVSVNAASESTYEKIMGLDYKRLLKNMELILKHNKNSIIEVSFVVLDENKDEVERFKEIWNEDVNRVEIRERSTWRGEVGNKIEVSKRLKKLLPNLSDYVGKKCADILMR